MYLANCTRPYIAFPINLSVRYSSVPTQRHWNDIKHILRYLQGTVDMCLFYSKESKQQLLEYAYARYLTDSHKAISQQGMCLIIMELLFHGDPLSKQWWPHHRIIQRL